MYSPSSPSVIAEAAVVVRRVGYAADFAQRLFRKRTAEGIDAVLRDHLGAMHVDRSLTDRISSASLLAAPTPRPGSR